MAGMRQWTRLRNETTSGTIRLATYNILAQHYVDTMPHLYRHCLRSKKAHLLQWINRKWFFVHSAFFSTHSILKAERFNLKQAILQRPDFHRWFKKKISMFCVFHKTKLKMGSDTK